ncbi:uncharacterized protein ARMOST_18830 [Armillaria ostoyae]|uniref:Uncharacterized protein n=1 Tax=Armillaria ostoyae TaxID=47428 RepID=A0A284S302_ARMOS|nr:uncharacterized protein ARMOST_18830 [Armillaria ostoyae]
MSIPPPGFVAGPPLAPTIPLNQRKDKTHGDDKNKARLATWSLSRKRAMNTLVKADNKDRLDKHAEPGHSAASSLASLLTTEGSQHTPTLPTSPKNSLTTFLQALAKITPKSKELFSGFLGLKNKQPRDAVDDSPEDITEKHKKIFNCSEEVERQPGSSFQFKGYHAELYRLADAKQYIPLHLFTLANIAIIHREGDTLPTKKIQDRGHALDLTELQWRDASPCYVDFLSSLRTSPDGVRDVAWAKRWEDHFFFFHNLIDFSLIYEAALATDIKLCIDYHNLDRGFKFSQQYYTSELSQMKEHIWDEKDHKREEEYTHMHNQLASQQSSRSLAMSFRQGTGRIMSSFRRSDAGTSLPDAAICLICARRGHHIHQCKFNSFESGQPTASVFIAGDRGSIALKAGNQSQKICISWNVSSDQGTCCSHGIPPLHLSPSLPLPLPDQSSIQERVITLYSPDTFDFYLKKHNISHLHSDLVQKLRNGFPMGDFPPLQCTVIFPNRTSSSKHKAFIDNYLQEEAVGPELRYNKQD